MNAPFCIRDGCKKPVRKAHDNREPKRGYRRVDGTNWGWFCSRQCAGMDQGSLADMERFRKGWRLNRLRAERRVLQRLVEACRGVMNERGMVRAEDMVRVLLSETRKAYDRGQGSMRRRREEAA